MNSVNLVGRLARNPELRNTGNNTSVANFTVAVKKNYQVQQGEPTAEYFPCEAWGKVGENIARYCVKGSLVSIKGRLKQHIYQNQQGVTVYETRVRCEEVEFLGSPQNAQNGQGRQYQQNQQNNGRNNYQNQGYNQQQNVQQNQQNNGYNQNYNQNYNQGYNQQNQQQNVQQSQPQQQTMQNGQQNVQNTQNTTVQPVEIDGSVDINQAINDFENDMQF